MQRERAVQLRAERAMLARPPREADLYEQSLRANMDYDCIHNGTFVHFDEVWLEWRFAWQVADDISSDGEEGSGASETHKQ